jgi:autotransporter-associated beta strand protein
MKLKSSLKSFLALAGSSLLAVSSAHAATYYWDTNSNTAGLGDTAGTWGTSALFRTIGNGEARGVIDGTLSTFASQNGAQADIFYFGTVNLALGSTASTIGINGSGVTAGMIVFGAGQGSQGVTLSSGGGAITMLNTGTTAPIIVSNNTGTNTIGAVLSGSNGLAVYGPGTLLLTGANNFTGGTNGLIVRNGATLQVGNGTSGSLTSQNLTFNNGGGVFNVRAVDTGSTQAMGALTFSTTGIGDSTVQSTFVRTSGNAELTFASLAARGAGATGNFVVSGGTNGTTNKIVFTSTTNVPLHNGSNNQGLYFGGTEFARYDSGGFIRATNYGTDTNASALVSGATIGSTTASTDIKLNGNITGQTTTTVNTINLDANNLTFDNTAQTLSVAGILSAGSASASIANGTNASSIRAAASNGELVIRVNGASDALTIAPNIVAFGTSSLTKSGAGTLILSGTNTYTGNTNINSGILAVSGGNAIADANSVVMANAAGAILRLDGNETITSLSGGGFSGGNVNVQGNTLTLGGTNTTMTFGGQLSGTSAGGIIKTGSGTLTLSNKNTFLGTITVSAGTLSFAYGNDATSDQLALSSGGAISLNSGTTLNFAPGSNTLVGTVGNQLLVGKGWTIGNDINVAAGTANITFGSSNDSRWTFNGGISGSSTPATATTLAITTASSSGDRQMATFAGVIQDGSGGALGLNITARAASAGAFVNLANSNTFTGAIGMNTTTAQPGYLVIGGVRNSAGLTTGSGSLGSGGVYNNTISLTQSSTGAPILNYASSANQTLGGAISGTNGQLWKDGAGTLTLSVANSYTGATSVNAGTLVVTGAISASSGVTVKDLAILAGESSDAGVTNGKVSAITLNGGNTTRGILAPGNGTAGDKGTLYGTSLAWNGVTTAGNSQMVFDLGAIASNDKLVLSGAMTKGTGSIFEWDFGGTALFNTTYTLVTAAGGFGTFADTDFSWKAGSLGAGLTVGTFTITGTSLTFTAIPEPTSAILSGLLIGAGLLRRRRRA